MASRELGAIMIDAALAERERLTRAHVQSALACSWTGHIYDYEQVAKQLNLVVDALKAEHLLAGFCSRTGS